MKPSINAHHSSLLRRAAACCRCPTSIWLLLLLLRALTICARALSMQMLPMRPRSWRQHSLSPLPPARPSLALTSPPLRLVVVWQLNGVDPNQR